MRPSDILIDHTAHAGELIDVALAVNAAPTLDEAFCVLADSAASLLGCDRLAVVIWNRELSSGVVRAGSGEAAGCVGTTIPADPRSALSVATGEPDVGPPIVDGLPSDVRLAFQEIETVVRIPLVTANCRATLNASWRTALAEEDAKHAVATLERLSRLTMLAARTEREFDRAHLDAILDAVGDGVVVTIDGRSLANAAAQTLLGATGQELPPARAFHPRSVDGVPFEVGDEPIGVAARMNPRPHRFRIRVTSLDGRELIIDGTVAELEGGAGAVVVFRDVTAEYAREFVNEQYVRALFDSLPTAVQVTDPATGQVLAANRAFANLVERDIDDIVGAHRPYPWWSEDELPRNFDEERRYSRVYRRPNGEPVPVDIELHPVLGPDGQPAAYLGVAIDTSESRRLERQLVQGGKLAAIGELAAGVAHEINNPLFAILGLTEFLLKEAEPGSKAQSRLELIQQTGLEIKEIVRALLDFARENAEERHVVPLQDVVEQTVELVRRTNAHKGIEIVHVFDGRDTSVSASPNQLKQIFLNLMANARQAMPEGGTVRIEVRADGDDAVATVSDDGPGISDELLTRIFEPFFTTKRTTGGTGLGLSVSLGIAEAHGGSLTAESREGEGATFTVRLPLAKGDDE